MKNDYLMQFQADILGISIARAKNLETTALGAAFLAGLTVGYWKDLEELKSLHGAAQIFEPKMVNLVKRICTRLEESSQSHSSICRVDD